MTVGTPIPSREREMRASGHSEAKTYELTPEELAEIRRKYGYNGPSSTPPADDQKPNDAIPDAGMTGKEPDKMERSKKFTLSKNEYLTERLRGKSRKQIAKEQGISLSNLENYWLKKWGIKDPTEEELAMIEADRKNDPESTGSAAEPAADIKLKPGVYVSEVIGSVESVNEQRRGVSADKPDATEGGTEPSENPAPTEEKAAPAAESQTPRYLTLRIPLLDSYSDVASQRIKCLEELDEVSDELEFKDIHHPKFVAEIFDLFQAYTGLIRCYMEELIDGDVNSHIVRFFEKHNQLHIEKVLRYAADRGWKVITD
jgi:hypothetical protein